MKDFNFDIKQLRTFTEVVECGGFTSASRKLRMAQASVSHHISQLEEMLGTRLFVREGRKVSLTMEGGKLLAFCRDFFAGVENLRKELEGGSHSGKIKIVSSNIPSAYILPAALVKLRKFFPGLVFEINVTGSREASEKVKDGVYDIGLSGRKFQSPNLEYRKILTDEIVLIAPRNFPDAVSPSQLPDFVFVGREKGSGTRAACESALSSAGVMPSDLKIAAEFSNNETVKQAVAEGLGAAFVSSLSVKSEKESGRFKIVKIRNFGIKRDFFVMYLKNRKNPFLKEFLKALTGA